MKAKEVTITKTYKLRDMDETGEQYRKVAVTVEVEEGDDILDAMAEVNRQIDNEMKKSTPAYREALEVIERAEHGGFTKSEIVAAKKLVGDIGAGLE